MKKGKKHFSLSNDATYNFLWLYCEDDDQSVFLSFFFYPFFISSVDQFREYIECKKKLLRPEFKVLNKLGRFGIGCSKQEK